MPVGVLEAILAETRNEIERLRARSPRPIHRSPIDVRARCERRAGDPLRLVAEIKKRSPSAGALSRALSVADRARVYEREGATMISVLVDRAHFDGSYDDLAEARGAVAAPILCKGFLLDEVQLDAAREAGADAALLILRILEGDALRRMIDAARARSLTPIVEVVDEQELERAVDSGADVLGVNARDLDTLRMNPARADRLLSLAPERTITLFFSGISRPEEIARLAATRVHGALIGEALMRRDDPSSLLAEMVEAAKRR